MTNHNKIAIISVPNCITCMNLLSGTIAVERALYGDFTAALLFILLAAVFDFFDGFFARLLKSFSPVGKDLDSLADVVSFGVAPACMVFALIVQGTGPVWYAYSAFIFAAFAALRLAKFNVDPRQSMSFIGLPSPAAGLLVAGFIYNLNQNFGTLDNSYAWMFCLAFSWCVGILMIVEIPMFALKLKEFTVRKYALQIAFAVVSIVLLIAYRLEALVYILLLYIVLSLLAWFVHSFGKSAKDLH